MTPSMKGQQEISITERVNVQSDSARVNQIIDGEWVAVGSKKPHAIVKDFSVLFQGKPSYRFELKEDDNTLEGYGAGETKGRAEFSYCYATHADFAGSTTEKYQTAQKKKTVYHYGKGICPQGSQRKYTFSVYVPSSLSPEVSTIFAQWHGMPDRTLASDSQGNVKKLSDKEFLDLYEQVIFKKNTAHEKVPVTDKAGNQKKVKDGNLLYKAGKKTGWLIEQGGYPPMAFGFANGFFYIKANSDRKWLTDKTDRCNINVTTAQIMKPAKSEFKAATIAYKMPFDQFPKDCWITFDIDVTWSKYGEKDESVVEPGKLDVVMSYEKNGQKVADHIVDNQEILIGRNDEDGYYFKFGIYRVGNSTVPVRYNLAGYKEF
ncbi:MAG: heparin lyase I family protein [Bacteroidales bacterium]